MAMTMCGPSHRPPRRELSPGSAQRTYHECGSTYHHASLGHRPPGHYRDRFRRHLAEPTLCILHSGAPAYHTHEHVLLRCDYYTRKYQYSSIEELLESMDPFYDILRFLQDNPTALSFEDAPDYS